MPERAIMAMARARQQSTSVAGRQDRFRGGRIPHGRGPHGEAAVGVLRPHGEASPTCPREMRNTDLSYAELFWTNTPYFRPAVYKMLDELNRVDYSPTYYFRVRQAMRLLELYRQSPDVYAEPASGYQGRFGWSVRRTGSGHS